MQIRAKLKGEWRNEAGDILVCDEKGRITGEGINEIVVSSFGSIFSVQGFEERKDDWKPYEVICRLSDDGSTVQSHWREEDGTIGGHVWMRQCSVETFAR